MPKKLAVVAASLVVSLVSGCGPEAVGPDVASVRQRLTGPMPYRGVNLASAEFGVNSDGTGSNPGTFGSTYTWPDPAYVSGYTSADYFLGKGMTTFRVPFRWERLQPTRNAPFNAAELARLRTTVNRLLSKGAVVILDPHNYARYGTNLIGSAAVPNADFADFWARLAAEYPSNPNVLFGLMNEPYDLPTEQWVSAANAAIAAIRATGANNLILVPGNAWTGAHSWTQNWYGTPNGTALLNVVDPGNNVAFEAHQYFDSNYSGTGSTCVSGAGGAQLAAFTAWLRANNKRGFLGEFATGTSATCLTVLQDVLTYLDANNDVYLGWTWWAAGPWWGSSWTSLEPGSGGADTAQMTAMLSHLGSTPTAPTCSDGVQNGTETGVDCGGTCAACMSAPTCSDGVQNGTETGVDCGGTCAACPVAPTCSDGVQNGTETGVDCGGSCAACPVAPTCSDGLQNGTETGVDCGGSCVACPVAPTCSDGLRNGTETGVDCGGSCAACATCSDGVQNGAETGVDCGGACGPCAVEPTCSDGVQNGAETGVDCGGTCAACAAGPTCTDGVMNGAETDVDCGGSCAPCDVVPEPSSPPAPAGLVCAPATYQAEAMRHSSGAAVSRGWQLTSHATLAVVHGFHAGPTTLTVTARGAPAGGTWPRLRVSVGGRTVGSVTVSSSQWRSYDVTFDVGKGSADVRLTFFNDGGNRSVTVDQLRVGCP